MEEELEKTKQSYQTQISAHEKKAHNNWVSVYVSDIITIPFNSTVCSNMFKHHVTDDGLIFQLAARAADRDLADIRRENALLRQK